MKEISQRLNINPSHIAQTVKSPTNRDHTKSHLSPISALSDPQVIKSMEGLAANEKLYTLRLLRKISDRYKTIGAVRSEMGNDPDTILQIFDQNDSDTAHDMTIIRTFFMTGPFRSMDR